MANLWTIYFKEFQMLRAMQAQSDSCLSWVPGDATRGPARQRHHVACVCLCLSGDGARFNHCLFASNPHQNIKKVIR